MRERHKPIAISAVRIDDCREIVARHYRISRQDMLGVRRTKKLARPRMMAMVLAREFTGASLPYIGMRFGGRDHTTVLSAMRRVPKIGAIDHDFQRDMDKFRIRLERLKREREIFRQAQRMCEDAWARFERATR